MSDFGPKFAELDDFLGFGKCFGGFGAGGGQFGGVRVGSGGGFGVAGAGVWVLGKFLVIFGDLERWGKIFGDLEGLKDLEGFAGILKGGMISGDFYRYVTPLVSIGMVFYFSKSGNALPCW